MLKRNILFLTILFLTIITFGLTFKGVGIVVELSGKCEYQPVNSDNIVKLKKLQDVYMGDTIITDEDGRVKILFSDEKTCFTLGSDSEVQITKFIYDPIKDKRENKIKVLKGKLRFLMKKVRNDNSEVQTTTATIGIKGTHFIAESANKRESRVVMIKGQAIVKNINPAIKGEVILKNKMLTKIFFDKPPLPPQIVNMEEIENLIEETTVNTSFVKTSQTSEVEKVSKDTEVDNIDVETIEEVPGNIEIEKDDKQDQGENYYDEIIQH